MTRSVMRCLALLLALAFGWTALDAKVEVLVIYDTEYGGYVPVVGGIERPDLVTKGADGRVPDSAKVALRRGKKGARKNRMPVVPRLPTLEEITAQARKPSRRWLRKEGVATLFLVMDDMGQPVEGARVYRYSDPSFYGMNQDETGARLWNTWRFLPRPFSGAEAEAAAALFDEHWRAENWLTVREQTPNTDQFHNPWARLVPCFAPPLEYVGQTGSGGSFRAISGLFNLRDPRRFSRAVVPSAMRLGFVVVADGFLPAVSEKRFNAGGLVENRTIQLLRAPSYPVFTSMDWSVALRNIDNDRIAPDRPVEVMERDLAGYLDRLVPALVRVPEAEREQVKREVEARIWQRWAQRALGNLRVEMLRRVVAATPGVSPRILALAQALIANEPPPSGGRPAREAIPPSPALEEAELLLNQLTIDKPQFLPAFPLLDLLLVRRGAPDDVRREAVNRLMRVEPFDPWGRARMAVFLLRGGKVAEAFDHLRYTYLTVPGLGGDRELAIELSAYYWRNGLPEKAGAYAWLLTGRVPEDPFTRPKGLPQ